MVDRLNMKRENKNKTIENFKMETKDTLEDVKEAFLFSFPCLPCNIIYKTARSLRDHTTYKHGENDKCDLCGKIFSSKKKCNQHMFNKHGDKRFSCTKCGAKFVKSFQLQRHEKSCSKRSRAAFSDHKCEFCQTYFNRKSSVWRHVKNFHKNIDSVRDKILIHNTKPLPRKVLCCEFCSQVFRKKCDLLRHMQVHNKNGTEIVYLCKECHDSFGSSLMLGKHYSKYHPEISFPCTVCNKDFPNKTKRSAHMWRAHDSGNFECPNCGKNFTRKLNKKMHQKINCARKYVAWEELRHKRTKIQRMKSIIIEIGKDKSYMAKNKKLCFYNSLISMSEREKENLQDIIDDHVEMLGEANESERLTVEGVINKVKKEWVSIECHYCGEEIENTTNLQKHLTEIHPTQDKYI